MENRGERALRLFGLLVAIALVFVGNANFGDHHAPLAAEADKDLPPLPTCATRTMSRSASSIMGLLG
jgi:hypothetical protein